MNSAGSDLQWPLGKCCAIVTNLVLNLYEIYMVKL